MTVIEEEAITEGFGQLFVNKTTATITDNHNNLLTPEALKNYIVFIATEVSGNLIVTEEE